jgi:hypothetical protein
MPKRKFKKCWDHEEVEREKRWRKKKMTLKRQADQEVRAGLEKWQNANSEY